MPKHWCANVFPAVLVLLLAACGASAVRDNPVQQIDGAADINQLIDLFETRYAYLAESGCNTVVLREELDSVARHVTHRAQLIPLLERALDCLHDPHATLGTNLDTSTRLIPTGLEAWATLEGESVRVSQVRYGTQAWIAGLRSGDRIVRFHNEAANVAIDRRMPCCQTSATAQADVRQWALLALLAGRHDRPVALDVTRAGIPLTITYTPAESKPRSQQSVTFRRLPGNIGYIALHNLGDEKAVVAFDAALTALRDTRRLVLDLRDTPGGGNTDVAEPILGRFIQRPSPYQRIQPMHGAAWNREVTPRGPWIYDAPIDVLVSRWTGSMGEGMAIGLDGMQRANVCGSGMAGLKGAIFDHQLSSSGIMVKLPGERLAHLNGTPREAWLPPTYIDDAESDTSSSLDTWINDSVRACETARAK